MQSVGSSLLSQKLSIASVQSTPTQINSYKNKFNSTPPPPPANDQHIVQNYFLLWSSPHSKLENQPLSVVHDCLFKIFAPDKENLMCSYSCVYAERHTGVPCTVASYRWFKKEQIFLCVCLWLVFPFWGTNLIAKKISWLKAEQYGGELR
jgi:hypothetical protein